MTTAFKNTQLILVFLSLTFVTFAQKSGTIEYSQKMKLDIQVDGMDMEMIKDMFPSSRETMAELKFENNVSTFEEKAIETEEQTITSEDQTIQISIMESTLESILYTNYKTMKSLDQTEFMGKQFLVSSDIEKRKWKLTNEKVMYLDYECIKATSENEDGEEVIAWFAPQIPQKIGPLTYGQLPGAILMLSVGGDRLEFKATSVTFEDVSIEKPKKGKKVDEETFNKIMEEKMKEMNQEHGESTFIIRG